jgi:hypothetical protein
MLKGIPLAQIDRQYQYKQQYGVMDNPQALATGNAETAPAEQPQQVTIINNYQSAPEQVVPPMAPETCLPGYTYSASLGYCVRNINYYGCIPGVEFWDPVSQTCSRNWPVCDKDGVNDLNTGACIYPPKPVVPPASYESFKALTNTTLTKEQYDAQVAAGNPPKLVDNTVISTTPNDRAAATLESGPTLTKAPATTSTTGNTTTLLNSLTKSTETIPAGATLTSLNPVGTTSAPTSTVASSSGTANTTTAAALPSFDTYFGTKTTTSPATNLIASASNLMETSINTFQQPL